MGSYSAVPVLHEYTLALNEGQRELNDPDIGSLIHRNKQLSDGHSDNQEKEVKKAKKKQRVLVLCCRPMCASSVLCLSISRAAITGIYVVLFIKGDLLEHTLYGVYLGSKGALNAYALRQLDFYKELAKFCIGFHRHKQ